MPATAGALGCNVTRYSHPDEPRPVGTTVPRARTTSWGYVDPDAVYAFARATNDANELYATGERVPPLFTSSLLHDAWHIAHEQGTARAVITDYRGGVHGEHDVLYWSPIRPGMTVHWRSEPRSARRTKGGVVLTISLRITDSEGAPLVDHLWSSYFIGGRAANEFGPDLPDHSFPEQARKSSPRRTTLFVDRDQGFRYAGVSGDRVTHAIDDEAARSAGISRQDPARNVHLCDVQWGCGHHACRR